MAELGRPIRDKFLLEPSDGVFLNHGAFGATPKEVLAQRFRYLEEAESQPDIYMRKKHFELWRRNVHKVSGFLGADPKNLVFVNNTTAAINTVIKSLDLKPGNAILTFTYTFRPVRNACIYTARRTGAEVLTMDFRPPIPSVDHVVQMYDKYLTNHPNVKVVVIDYISCRPCVRMPLEKLVPVFRKHDVMILVDGAHTPGQLVINLEEMGVDFYAGTLHKWMFTPRGCAVLWISPKYHDVIRPVVTARSPDDEDLLNHFMWQGSVDHTNFFCAEAAIEFVNKEIGGQDAYIAYCSDLADKASDLLVERFGTKRYEIPPEMQPPFLRMIQVPRMPGVVYPEEDKNDLTTCFGDVPISLPFWDRYKVMCVFCFAHGEPWLRISCNVYNTLEDYSRLADCYLQMVAEGGLKEAEIK